MNLLPVSSSLCCGCTACASVCAKHAISMREDNEGFFSPVLDSSLCVDCGLCTKVCPILHPNRHPAPETVRAALSKDDSIRSRSSSGGIAFLLASVVIERGGAVVGAALEGFYTRHIIVETQEELVRLQGSKYVQSELGDIYLRVKNLLDAGRELLFSGTPCQVAGLRNFLRKDYDNLLTMDVICHGVPSPGVLRRYIDELKAEYPAAASLSFRDKKEGWTPIHAMSLYDRKGHTLYRDKAPSNVFIRGFLDNVFDRSSCASCPFTSPERVGDITIADFWKVAEINPKLNDKKGTSLIFLNTEKGASAYTALAGRLAVDKTVPVTSAVARQAQLRGAAPGSALREEFFKFFTKGNGGLIDWLEKKLFKVGILNFHFANNFGAVLVPYSLAKVLENMGVSAEIINYFPHVPEQCETFENFRSRHFVRSRKFSDYKELEEYSPRYNRIVVGSDQVWRMFDTGIYMCNWASGKKLLVSYAASFGHDEYAGNISKEDASACLKRFDAVSVREASGVDICKELGVEAEHVLDPTLLLNAEDYIELIDEEKPSISSEKYVCQIMLNRANLAEIEETPFVFTDIKNRYPIVDALKNAGRFRSVAGWLEAIRKAEYVIADSFHGIVFSIIFKKQFVCIVADVNGRGRIPSLLKTLCIPESRIYSSVKDIGMDCFEEKIDYSIVEKSLQEEREKSLQFLHNALEKQSKNKEKVRTTFLGKTLNSSPVSLGEIALLENEWRILRKYYTYKLLSKVTWGQRRKRYREKCGLWKERVRHLRALKKKLMQMV